MKNLYIVFLFSFCFKVQASFCNDLSINKLKTAQDLLEIEQAYRTLSPLKNETAEDAYKYSLRAYQAHLSYMQYVSEEEKNKQKKELTKARDLLKEHGLHHKSRQEIELFLARKSPQSQLSTSFFQDSNDDDDLNEDSFKEIDEACKYSQSYDQQNKNQQSIISRGSSFYNYSQKDQTQNENLSLSSNDFLEYEGERTKPNSIEEALMILDLTQETYDKECIQYKKSLFEVDYVIGEISEEKYQSIVEAANFLISNIH